MTRAALKPRVKPPSSGPTRFAHAPRSVRIIGGQWKRSLLPVVEAEGLRPTPDRVRETTFNWLGHLLDGRWERCRFLDLFAGTGAMGFEAASRGGEALLVEKNPVVARRLDETRERLHAERLRVQKADALSFVQATAPAAWDVIFLDPPYALDLLPRMLESCAPLLRADGLVYAESDKPFPEAGSAWLTGWEVVRNDRAGHLHYCLLRRTKLA